MLFDCALKRGDVERARACRVEKERLATWHQLLVARKLQVRRDPSARLPRLGLALLWLEVERLAHDDLRRRREISEWRRNKKESWSQRLLELVEDR